MTDSFCANDVTVAAASAAVVAAAGTTPAALFTAHPINADAARAMGFHEVIAKPFDLVAFEGHIHSVLRADVWVLAGIHEPNDARLRTR